MSGVIVVMRRTLLSCTSLARKGFVRLAAAALPTADRAMADQSLADQNPAGNGVPLETIANLLEFSRQEIAALMTMLALLGFSVVAAILLVRTRMRAARKEARLRANIAELQLQADRYRALLFAEPQILISWNAGAHRPQISGDTALLVPPDEPQRILAFGTWLPPEPALQLDRAVDKLREAGEGFLLHLSSANGHAI